MDITTEAINAIPWTGPTKSETSPDTAKVDATNANPQSGDGS